MTTFRRRGHWRTNSNGTTYWVSGHDVNRVDWGRYGLSEDREYLLQKEIRSVESRPFDDFIRSTTCPICGATVYFVRYNGGCVWLDSLGWPWPKHSCFNGSSGFIFSITKKELCKLKVEYFGIVIEVRQYKETANFKFIIRCSNKEIVEALFECHGNAKDWIGQLVIISKKIANITIDNIFMGKLTGKIVDSKPKKPDVFGNF